MENYSNYAFPTLFDNVVERLVCNICWREYITRDHFEKHIRSHTNQLMIPHMNPHFIDNRTLVNNFMPQILPKKILEKRNSDGSSEQSINISPDNFFNNYLDKREIKENSTKENEILPEVYNSNTSTVKSDDLDQSNIDEILKFDQSTSESNPPSVRTDTSECASIPDTDVKFEFACDICKKSFRVKQQLQVHEKTHTDDRSFPCNVCGNSFKLKQQLQMHVKSHEDHRPFVCDICQKGFKFKQQLQNHIRVHDNLRPFQCDQCDKSFKLKQQLQNHQNKHAGTKSYSCEFCSKTFMFKQQMQVHFKIHFGIKEFPCPTCNKQFRTKQQLQVHMNMHIRKGHSVS